ncbi:MAG: hypothetical protein HN823_02830, partial [Gammaproteobacteria bacterium]|nr:hypothetical protein [Gammaproteobacteria bacterium]
MTTHILPIENFVTHLECSQTGKHYRRNTQLNLSDVGKPLLVRYDLKAIKSAVSPATLNQRPQDLWRYQELLPLTQAPISLGESITPLL